MRSLNFMYCNTESIHINQGILNFRKHQSFNNEIVSSNYFDPVSKLFT